MVCKDVKDMSLDELFERFKRDIIYDAHSLSARYERSEATKELLDNRVSVDTLKLLIRHLRDVLPIENEIEVAMELEKAWTWLIMGMCLKLSINIKSGPNNYEVLDWCDWVEAQVLTV